MRGFPGVDITPYVQQINMYNDAEEWEVDGFLKHFPTGLRTATVKISGIFDGDGVVLRLAAGRDKKKALRIVIPADRRWWANQHGSGYKTVRARRVYRGDVVVTGVTQRPEVIGSLTRVDVTMRATGPITAGRR